MKKLAGLAANVLGLDGVPIIVGGTPEKPVYETVGRMIANVLARGQSDDPVRAMMVALEIHSSKAVDLEDADFELVTESVNKDQLLTNLGKAACLKALNGATSKQ